MDRNVALTQVEKFVALGGLQPPAAGHEHDGDVGSSSSKDGSAAVNLEGLSLGAAPPRFPDSAGPASQDSSVHRTTTGDQPLSPAVRMALHVGVLHYSPSSDVFPLLADPST